MASADMDEATASLIASMVADNQDHFEFDPSSRDPTSFEASYDDISNDEQWEQDGNDAADQYGGWPAEDRAATAETVDDGWDATTEAKTMSWNRDSPATRGSCAHATERTTTIHDREPTIVNSAIDPDDEDHSPPSAAAKGKGKALVNPVAHNDEPNDDDDEPEDGEVDRSEDEQSDDNDDDDEDEESTTPRLPPPAKRSINKAWNDFARPNAAGEDHESDLLLLLPEDSQDCEYHYDEASGKTIPHLTIPWSFSAARLGIVYREPTAGERGGRRRRGGRTRDAAAADYEGEYDLVEVHEIYLDEGEEDEDEEEMLELRERDMFGGLDESKAFGEMHRKRVKEFRRQAEMVRRGEGSVA